MMIHGASLFRNRDAQVLPIFVSIVIVLAVSAGFMTTYHDWTEVLQNMFDVWSVWGDLTYMWPPEHAFAQSIQPTLKLTTAGSISDDDNSGLSGARYIATFESDGRAYAAVGSIVDDTFQILNLTDPYNITVVSGITDDDDLYLNGVLDIAMFESDDRAYAAVYHMMTVASRY